MHILLGMIQEVGAMRCSKVQFQAGMLPCFLKGVMEGSVVQVWGLKGAERGVFMGVDPKCPRVDVMS